jgi:hypothetical protein
MATPTKPWDKKDEVKVPIFTDRIKQIQFRESTNIPTVGPYSTVINGEGGITLYLHKAGVIVSASRTGKPRFFLVPFAVIGTIELEEAPQ